MYLHIEIALTNNVAAFRRLIRAHAQRCGIDAALSYRDGKLCIAVLEEEAQTHRFFESLESILPASIFVGATRAYRSDTSLEEDETSTFPVNIAPCPTCQKEMFDVASRRYYYPFTSCQACGSQHPFVERYPYTREHTSMRFFTPCEGCLDELKHNPFRRDYPLISCVECGIALKMTDTKSERYANTKGEYRRLFEVSARALSKGKSVRMKTLHGYRRFFLPEIDTVSSQTMVMFADTEAFNTHLMMVPQEFDALLSIERPILRVATKSDRFKALFGGSVYVKYADEGMSMLLARELLNVGLGFIAFEACDANTSADYYVDFDLPIRAQRDLKLFINRDEKRIVEGERVVFPRKEPMATTVMAVSNDLVAVPTRDGVVIDATELFEEAQATEVRLVEGTDFESTHSHTTVVPKWRAAILSVLAEHGLLKTSIIGVHFDDRLSFLYHNGKSTVNLLPYEPFSKKDFWDRIAALREGSDRLVVNFRQRYGDVAERLERLDDDAGMFDVAAVLMGLEQGGLDGIASEALKFLGKGGLQVDTRVRDNRFDAYAFLASIMSYKTADVPNDLLCYSIYESLGDYIGDIVGQIADKMKTDKVAFSGETFANQALYARIERSLRTMKRYWNEILPMGSENGVVGALYL